MTIHLQGSSILSRLPGPSRAAIGNEQRKPGSILSGDSCYPRTTQLLSCVTPVSRTTGSRFTLFPVSCTRRMAGMTTLMLGFALLIAPVFAAPPAVQMSPLHFKPGQAERTTLSNGVIVYLLEDHELPIFDMNIRMKSSPADAASFDPFDFVGEVWRTGGTKTRTPEQLNSELEQMAMSVETGADEETFSVSLACLSKNKDKGIEIFSDVLLHPAFREDQLSLAKAKELEGLRRKNDTPPQIARRAFRDAVYGKAHVYAHESTEKGVQRVSAADLLALHKRVVVPDAAVICVAGDFDKAEMLASLEKIFGAWKSAERVVPPYDFSARQPSTGTVFFVQKDSNQSRVTMGRLGPARHHPDHFVLELADYMLGGGGPSRLFGEIRSRLGLAYVVASFYQVTQGPGLMGVACQTKSGSTIAAIKAIQSELDKFSKGPIHDDELRLAKDSIENSFVFGFDSPWEIVNARATNEFYGFPADYLDTYADRIEGVSKEAVQAAARKYYVKENMKTMVVGNEKGFDAPIDTLGSVTRLRVEDIP